MKGCLPVQAWGRTEKKAKAAAAAAAAATRQDRHMLELALLANACLASRARAHVACRVQPLASPPPETFDPRAPPAAQGQWKGGPFERSCCTCPPCLGARAYIADSGAYIPTMRLSTASVASAGDLRAFCIDHDLASFRRRARDAPAGARGPIPSPWRGRRRRRRPPAVPQKNPS